MSSSFQDHLAELFAPLGGVSFRKMFGGLGIFRDGLMFALVADEALYMKADQASSPTYAAQGSSPFVFKHAGQGDADVLLASSGTPARGP